MSDIDDNVSVPITERICQLSNLNDEEVCIYCIQCFNECLSACDSGYIKDILIPTIKRYAFIDILQVTKYLFSMLPVFCEKLFEFFPNNAEEILADGILPIVHDVILKRSNQVCKFICESWASIISLLDILDFLKNEIPVLESLSTNPKKDVKIIVLNVLSFLIDCFDPDKWHNALDEIINKLTNDKSPFVRCLIPPIIAQYSRRINDPVKLAQINGRFTLLCRDSIMVVRKACAESLASLSESLNPTTRMIVVLPAIDLFINDQSDVIRAIISKNLGPLISSIGPSIDPQIVHMYCNSLLSKEITECYPAAFSFPAVALTLGKDRFDEIRTGLKAAVKSIEYRIRRTIAFGLYSFGYLLDPAECEEFSINFLKDIPSVAIGIISNLNFICDIVSNPENLFFCLEDPISKYKEWRVRLKVSEQLRYCSEFFDKKKLLTIAKELLRDDTSIVRKDAVSSVSLLMEDSEDDNIFIDKLANSDNYQDRIVAVMILEQTELEKIKSKLDLLKDLADDPVANVRISVANAIGSITSLDRSQLSKFEEIANKLKDDEDNDVQEAILSYKKCFVK